MRAWICHSPKLQRFSKRSIKLATEKFTIPVRKMTGCTPNFSAEFLAAALHAKLFDNERWIKDAFDKFDSDGSGTITLTDLQAVLGDSFNGVAVHDMMRHCDPHQKGEITYQDFREIIVSAADNLEEEQHLKTFY